MTRARSSAARQARRRPELPASFEDILRENPALDAESTWQLFKASEEYMQLRVFLRAIAQLPAPDVACGESRAEYEFCLHALCRLGDMLQVEKIPKSYRAYYSPEVQLSGYLYSTLLTAFTLLPSYLLNGQEYYVSDTVLDQCHSLQQAFAQTCREVKRHFETLSPYALMTVRQDVKRSLVYFDRAWCRFEIPALEEIEAIHRQACRPLIDAIHSDQQLSELEKGRATGQRIREEVQRSRLMEKICELNELANLDGKGRTDMDLSCVIEAEKVHATTVCCSYNCRVLAGFNEDKPACCHVCGQCTSPVSMRIARTLLSRMAAVRRLLKRYAKCLYQVNSHLANNPELVSVLERFEQAWELAHKYLTTPKQRLALYVYSLVTQVPDRAFQAALHDLEPEFIIKLSHAILLAEMDRSSGASDSPRCSKKGDAPGSTDLPRPMRRRRDRAPPVSVASEFLPPSMKTCYDETVQSLLKLSEEQRRYVHESLVTPNPPTPAGTPLHTPMVREDRQLQSSGSRRPDSRCSREPPRIPPRLLADGIEVAKLDEDELDDEDLGGCDVESILAIARACTPAPEPEDEVSPSYGDDPLVRVVINNVSVLGMHLQRHSPTDWNELIQIVLQGVIFGSKGCTAAAAACAGEPALRMARAVRDDGAQPGGAELAFAHPPCLRAKRRRRRP